MPARRTSAENDVAAAEWAVRVDNAPLNPAEQLALDSWLNGDSQRLGAFSRAKAILIHARRAKALGPAFDPDAYLDSHQSEVVYEESAPGGTARQMGRRAVLAGGASAAVAAGIAALGLGSQAAAQTYATLRGEIRLVPLSDGSTMTLNTTSTVKVSYTKVERRVELLQGEAMFDVANGARTPFNVYVGEAVASALGTSFTISRLKRHPVQILVSQGVVSVIAASAGATRVEANNRAIISTNAPITVSPIAPEELKRELAWREGMLSFDDMPLREVADEFARYSATRIQFEDAGIGDETVTGLFAANNPAGFADAVSLSLGLQVDRTGGNLTLRRVHHN